MSLTHVDWVAALQSGAAWLRATLADAYTGTFALFVDYVQEGAREATRARYPSECAEDALPELGHARRMPRWAAQTTASYRVSLRTALTLHRDRATKHGVLSTLTRAGFAGAELYEGFQWPTRPPQPWPSQFWIVFPAGSWGAIPSTVTVGSGVAVGSGLLVGVSGVTSTEVQSVRAAIRWAKRGTSLCREIITVVSGALVGTGVLVGSGATVGGSVVVIAGS